MESQEKVNSKEFKIAVSGDTGYDTYTEGDRSYESFDKRINNPSGNYDVYVPSGASLIATFLHESFHDQPSKNINLTFFDLPKDSREKKYQGGFATLQKWLVKLGRCKDGCGPGNERIRVFERGPILDNANVPDRVEIQKTESFRERILPDKGDQNENRYDAYDLLVLHHGAASWKYNEPQPDGAGDAGELVRRVLSGAGNRAIPRVIIDLGHDLPDIEHDNNSKIWPPENRPIWQELANPKNLDKVVIVCSVNMLRKEGAAISRRLSFEQTVEDIAADLLLYERFKWLSVFKHVIIRLSMVGAIHILTEGRERSADLVFAPLAKSGVYRDPLEDGEILGKNGLMIAAIVNMFAQKRLTNMACSRQDFIDAMKSGLLAAMRAFDAGYKVPWDKSNSIPTPKEGERLLRDLINPSESKVAVKTAKDAICNSYENQRPSIRSDQILGDASVPVEILIQPPASWTKHKEEWQLLRNAIDNPLNYGNQTNYGRVKVGTNDLIENQPISRINLGVAIVLFGHDQVLNHSWSKEDPTDNQIRRILNRPELVTSTEETRAHITLAIGKVPPLPLKSPRTHVTGLSKNPVYVPLLKMGDLVISERQEIQAIRSIRNLFRTYHETCNRGNPVVPPISVAVFGPPGSGKSFVVRQLAKDINENLRDRRGELEVVEYNVAQFRSVDELGEAITRASVINNEGKLPLVFFDEFDCSFEGNPLGWLKYFLAPMQDGRFYGVRQTIKLARAIFVFAGGIYPEFRKFDPSTGAGLSESDDSRLLEEREKRLRSFANQKGPDFISRLRGHIDILPVDSDSGQVKPIIRRALILRGILSQRKLVSKWHPKIAFIDEDVVYALLALDRYRHGARSMSAIIEMCTPINRRIEKSSLPSREQLNMHIDADAFYIGMYRGRLRPETARDPKGKATESTDQEDGSQKAGDDAQQASSTPQNGASLESPTGALPANPNPSGVPRVPGQ